MSVLPGMALLCIALALSAGAHSLDVSGRVVDAEGKPLPFVRVRLTGQDAVPFSTTVFSTADGSFAARDAKLAAKGLAIDAFRIGWKESARSVKNASGALTVSLTMEPIDNVAAQVPASAWLQGDPESLGYRMANLHCSACHQLAADRVRKFSARLKDTVPEDRAEAWVTRAAEDLAGTGKTVDPAPAAPSPASRDAGWENVVQFMRWVTMRLGEENKLRWGLQEGSEFYNALLEPVTSLFSPRDMQIIVPYLSHNFPTSFDTLTGYHDIEKLGDYGVTANTRIDEYVLPTFGWTREIAIAPGSDKVWFLETDKDRLGALDPADGSVKWYPVPGKGQQGPHTMNSDAEGNVWVALEDSFHIGRLNTATGKWRMYPPPAGTTFGVTHDFAYNSDRHVQADQQGRIWITDLGKNELWGLNIESGEIKTYRMPMVAGESSFHSLLYGAAIDAKNNRVWWAQLFGIAGSFDTEHNVAERILPYERGDGPRRLAIQDDGILWVPLYGSSELSKVDTTTGLELGRYRIPDRGGSPYGVTLDKKRNAVWAATSNSDRIYRFDIATGKWTHYPLPRRETFIRMIEVDPVSGDVWTTYSNLPVGKRDAAEWGTESANNIIVRLRPGD